MDVVVELLLLRIKRGQLSWSGDLFRMPPGRPPGDMSWAFPTGKGPLGKEPPGKETQGHIRETMGAVALAHLASVWCGLWVLTRCATCFESTTIVPPPMRTHASLSELV